MKSCKSPTLDPSSAVSGRCIPGKLATSGELTVSGGFTASGELARLAFVAGADGAMVSRLGSMQPCELYSASLAKGDACGAGGGNREASSLEKNTGVTALGIGMKSSSEESAKLGGTDPGSIAGGSDTSS
jgi:hypothetical protein